MIDVILNAMLVTTDVVIRVMSLLT